MSTRSRRRFGLFLLLLALLLGVWAIWFLRNSTLLRRDRTWEAMQSRQMWRVAIDPSFPPFEQLDDQNRISGFDVDLAQAIADRWNLQLEIVPTGFDSLIDSLRSGQVDSVISALPYDPRLTKDVAYSSGYFEAGIVLAIRDEQQCKEQGADCRLQIASCRGQTTDCTVHSTDLAGQGIAVELGSAGDVIARRWQRETPSIRVQRDETPEAAIQALQSDPSLTALLIDNVSLRIAQGQGAKISAIGQPIEGNPYVIALPVTAFTLRQQLEAALLALRSSTDFTQIEEKWFGEGGPQP